MDLGTHIRTTPAPSADWLAVAAILGLVVLVVGGALLTVRLITRVCAGIQDPAGRRAPYECGERPVGDAWFRFNNRFITVALTFLVMDVELALLWPILPRCLEWVGRGQGASAFVEIAAFAGALAIGLAWVARRGGFRWDRRVEDASDA
ncbi:MAG: hypothetical protein RLZZ127_2477 [Planctomycetota bacterium]|jgi:NADH-quinone oxidoreductase subunit A